MAPQMGSAGGVGGGEVLSAWETFGIRLYFPDEFNKY